MSVESNLVETVDYSPWVSARNCDFGKKQYLQKGYLKRSRMANFLVLSSDDINPWTVTG